MGENIFSNEDQLETGDNRDTERQKVDDATFEPRAHVEESGDFRQAEVTQKSFEVVVDNATADTGHLPDEVAFDEQDAVPDQQPVLRVGLEPAGQLPGEASNQMAAPPLSKIFTDPVTGEQHGDAGGGEGADHYEVDPQVLDPDADVKAAPAEAQPSLSGAGAEDAAKRNNEDVSGPEGDDKNVSGIVSLDEKGNRVGYARIPTGAHDFNGDMASQGFSGIEHQLPEALIDAIGMDAGGKLIQGGGKVGMPKSSGSSGGGPPVGNYGGGSRGEGGEVTINKCKSESEAKNKSEAQKDISYFPTNCVKGDNKYICKDGKGNYYAFVWYPLEGGSPMPYTGMVPGDGKAPAFPHGPDAGPDREAGFLRQIDAFGKKGATNKNVAFGYGSSGNSTFGPDGGGDDDDGGKFYGGLEGGGASGSWRPNPDDPDYYTPNVLSEIDKNELKKNKKATE